MARSVEEILELAIAIDSSVERASFLAQVCIDATQRQEVERLAECHFRAGDFLEQPCQWQSIIDPESATFTLAETIGAEIGPYQLTEQLGVGGFGVVFAAEQLYPVRRRVALKIIKPGMDTNHVLARFEAERQALALMNHPNVAQILDAGATDSGRPYFVMELVNGVPITRFCDDGKSSIHARLGLFVSVCHAVQHAHQKGIVHRDLKASNVLVALQDGAPVVKVIDFGIAKTLGPTLTDKSVGTAAYPILGTPQSMSPEQAGLGAGDIDTRSDVYALGILLYELLTGTTPIDNQAVDRLGFEEVRRIIREVDAPAPTICLRRLDAGGQSRVARCRGVEPSTLLRQLRGDLDWVVLKALEKDRDRRYQSPADFADDVERHLRNEPVEASPPSRAYRLGRFIRRHKGALVAVGSVVVMLVAGSAVSVWMALDATAARKLADERLANERLARRDADMQLARFQIAYGHAREAVHQLLARVGSEQVGTIPAMKKVRQQLLEDAAAFYSKLIELNPDDAQAYFERGQVYSLLSINDNARADFEKAVALDPNHGQAHGSLGQVLGDWLDTRESHPERAIRHLRRATELLPEVARYHEQLARIYRSVGRDAEADAAQRRAAELAPDSHRAAARDAKSSGDCARALTELQAAIVQTPSDASLYREAAKLCLDLRDPQQALALLKKAMELRPHDPVTYSLYVDRAAIWRMQHNLEAALADANKAIELAPYRAFLYTIRAATHFDLENYALVLADMEKAAELYPSALDYLLWFPPVAFANSPDESFRRQVFALADEQVEVPERRHLGLLGRSFLFASLGQYEPARRDLLAVGEHPSNPLLYQNRLALLALLTGDRAEFRRLCAKTIESARTVHDRAQLRFAVWTCLLAPDAVDDYGPVVELARRGVDPNVDTRSTERVLGAALFRAGQLREALRYLAPAETAALDSHWHEPCYAFLLAMTHHRLGHPAAAQRLFQFAAAVVTGALATERFARDALLWHRRATLQLLHAETRTALASSLSPPTSPAVSPSDRKSE